MRTEWRIVCNNYAQVFTDPEQAKAYVRALLTRPSALPKGFDDKALVPATYTMEWTVLVLRTDYMDGEFEVAT